MKRPDEADMAVLRCDTAGLPLLLEVFDTQMQPKGDMPAIGNAEYRLGLGVYVVRFSLGKQVDEQAVALTQAGEYLVRPTRPWHTGSGEWQSTGLMPPDPAGGQGQLCVTFADLHEPHEAPIDPIVLERADGTLVRSIAIPSGLGQQGRTIAQWQGPAGNYNLVVRAGSAPSETLLAVPVIAGWQTALFLLPRRYARTRAADLPRAGVCFTRAGTLLDPNDPELYLAQVMCETLEAIRGRQPVRIGSGWMPEQFASPLTGLFAAHLMLCAGKPRIGDLLRMLGQLLALVGWIPDVRALAWAIRGSDNEQAGAAYWRELEALGPLPDAPLLQDSCRLLLDADQRHAGVVDDHLRELLSEYGRIASPWFVRKRPVLPPIFQRRPVQSPAFSAPASGQERGWNAAVNDVLMVLKQSHIELLDQLADRLKPFEREVAETLYPLINPLAHGCGMAKAEIDVASATSALLSLMASHGKSRGIALASAPGVALAADVKHALLTIIQEARALEPGAYLPVMSLPRAIDIVLDTTHLGRHLSWKRSEPSEG